VATLLGKDDHRMGLFTVLLASGQSWNPADNLSVAVGPAVSLDPMKYEPTSALASYIADQVRINMSGTAAARWMGDVNSERFITRLAAVRDLHLRWQQYNSWSAEQRSVEFEKAAAYIRTCKDPAMGWRLLVLMQQQGLEERFARTVAELAKGFEDVPNLSYVARFENGVALSRVQGCEAEARKLLAELHRQAVESSSLPPINYDFYRAFQNSEEGRAEWVKLMRDASATVIAKASHRAGVYLAWQVYRSGDSALAEELFGAAAANVPENQRLATSLAQIEYLYHTGQYPRADAIMEVLLADEKYSKYPELWRLGSTIAGARGMVATALQRFERAVEMDYKDMPEVVNLETVRQDYSQLLAKYQQLADAIATLEKEPPRDLMVRTIRMADRWRVLDPEPTNACQAAARILRRLGAEDLAWDYLTTPLAQKSSEAAPWVSLAQQLSQQGDFSLADRAYETAFDLEPTNGQVLWQRAQLLQQNGRLEEARRVYQKLAEGTWQPRFQWFQQQAQAFLKGR